MGDEVRVNILSSAPDFHHFDTSQNVSSASIKEGERTQEQTWNPGQGVPLDQTGRLRHCHRSLVAFLRLPCLESSWLLREEPVAEVVALQLFHSWNLQLFLQMYHSWNLQLFLQMFHFWTVWDLLKERSPSLGIPGLSNCLQQLVHKEQGLLTMVFQVHKEQIHKEQSLLTKELQDWVWRKQWHEQSRLKPSVAVTDLNESVVDKKMNRW